MVLTKTVARSLSSVFNVILIFSVVIRCLISITELRLRATGL